MARLVTVFRGGRSVLRGPATSSFRYRLTLKNESDRDLLVNLEARTQKSFQVTFTPSFASQQVTSLPVKAGESKDIDTEVSLPREGPAGTYDIAVLAAAGGGPGGGKPGPGGTRPPPPPPPPPGPG